LYFVRAVDFLNSLPLDSTSLPLIAQSTHRVSSARRSHTICIFALVYLIIDLRPRSSSFFFFGGGTASALVVFYDLLYSAAHQRKARGAGGKCIFYVVIECICIRGSKKRKEKNRERIRRLPERERERERERDSGGQMGTRRLFPSCRRVQKGEELLCHTHTHTHDPCKLFPVQIKGAFCRATYRTDFLFSPHPSLSLAPL